MPERQLPAVPDQDVQAHDRDGQHKGLRPFTGLEAIDDGRQADEEEDHDEHQPVAGRQGAEALNH